MVCIKTRAAAGTEGWLQAAEERTILVHRLGPSFPSSEYTFQIRRVRYRMGFIIMPVIVAATMLAVVHTVFFFFLQRMFPYHVLGGGKSTGSTCVSCAKAKIKVPGHFKRVLPAPTASDKNNLFESCIPHFLFCKPSPVGCLPCRNSATR